MAKRMLYVLYNADGTVMGKLRYGYRKLTSSKPEATCAACNITHGGLSLKESPKWVDAKKEIESHQVKVIQWHRDEIDSRLREYVTSTGLRYPAVVLQTGEGDFTTIMTSADLNNCGGDPQTLVKQLRNKHILQEGKIMTSSL